MYTLYYSQGTCSLAVHAILNALNVPFELKELHLSKGEQNSPEFQKINPRGQVPTLVVDGKEVIREGAAIILWLTEKHKSNLMPEVGAPNRAKALEWLMFFNSTLHPRFSPAFGAARITKNEEFQQEIRQYAFTNIQKGFDEVEKQLSETTYLCGNEPTAADFLGTVISRWTYGFNGAVTLGPKTKAWVEKTGSHPAFQKALQTEGIELHKKAA
ncbi:MAG: glutathione S-transferase family protein [Alphaproteobacteria bacterium]|nr:glutathione S-transferase family protein [Alphaproteobacteria bacterium]